MHGLTADPAARILEMTGVRSLRKTAGLPDGAFAISQRLAVIHTTATRQEWEPRLTMMARNCPEEAVTATKWRKSCHGGKIWVRPSMRSEQAEVLSLMARARERGEEEMQRRKIKLIIPGSLGRRPSELMRQMIHEIDQVMGLQQGLVDEEGDLTEYKMWPLMSFDKTRQGTLVVMRSTAREAEEMPRHFHDQAITIDGQRTTVQAVMAEVAARGGQPRV
jgi:hypothetical protein